MATPTIEPGPPQRTLQTAPHHPHHKQALEPVTKAPQPEPAQLYSLIALTLFAHEPGANGCVWCEQQWPCPKARQAYRLREGF